MKVFDNKYNNFYNVTYNLEKILEPGERIIWEGKPKKNAYCINSIAALTPFALIWLLIDSCFIIVTISGGVDIILAIVLIAFFSIHLMPVWVWFGQMLTANKKWKNVKYALTDRRILIQDKTMALVGINYKDIIKVDFYNFGLDKFFGVGDVHIEFTEKYSYDDGNAQILDIVDAYEVYSEINRRALGVNNGVGVQYTPIEEEVSQNDPIEYK